MRKHLKQKIKEAMPVAEKLVLVERKLHSDNLKDQHFVELRQFLHKKKRQEEVAAKMSAKPGKHSQRNMGLEFAGDQD